MLLRRSLISIARPTLAAATPRAALSQRFNSTTRPAPPAEVQSWIDTLTAAPPVLRHDNLHLERTNQLQTTLPIRLEGSRYALPLVGEGEALPKAHHLLYFMPTPRLDQLGEDGTSTEYNAPEPYLRRMWAGGSFEWNPDVQLKIGEHVTESTRVGKVDFKSGMLFVQQEKTFFPGDNPEGDWAVKEIRNHVFRKIVTNTSKAAAAAPTEPAPADAIWSYIPSAPLLFRFSALTYNAHRIHYDIEWTRAVEGHPDLVVHGPMNASLLVELAESLAKESGRTLQKFEYRATSPMYVNKEITLYARGVKDGGQLVQMDVMQGGKVGMKASATLV